jgi:serine/threonine protein kinase
LDAISYLHSHQVLHLDLKPDNILLTHIDDDVKLIDLGFCRSDAFVDTQGYTSGFAAPEQFAGGMVDARTDIYAVGKILERLPDHRIYNKVIARCTAIEPAERYQSIEEIRSDINRRQHYSRYVAAIVAIVAIVGVGITLLTHREQTAPVIQETPVDSVVQMQDQGNRSLDSVQEHGPVPSIPSLDSVPKNPAPVPVNPPRPPKKDEQVLMKEEVERLIDKAYRSTIASFCDSVWPPLVNYPGNPWADSSTEFHNQVVEIGNRLVKKYPNIPESVIRQETEMHFQGFVGYTFNKMRENRQP